MITSEQKKKVISVANKFSVYSLLYSRELGIALFSDYSKALENANKSLKEYENKLATKKGE